MLNIGAEISHKEIEISSGHFKDCSSRAFGNKTLKQWKKVKADRGPWGFSSISSKSQLWRLRQWEALPLAKIRFPVIPSAQAAQKSLVGPTVAGTVAETERWHSK